MLNDHVRWVIPCRAQPSWLPIIRRFRLNSIHAPRQVTPFEAKAPSGLATLRQHQFHAYYLPPPTRTVNWWPRLGPSQPAEEMRDSRPNSAAYSPIGPHSAHAPGAASGWRGKRVSNLVTQLQNDCCSFALHYSTGRGRSARTTGEVPRGIRYYISR